MHSHPTHEQRLTHSSIELPAALPPFGQYVPAVLHGDMLWVGGHFGTGPDGALLCGRCGDDVDAASDVFVEVFGEAGRHTRLAVGVSSLPAHLVLEIQAQLVVAP